MTGKGLKRLNRKELLEMLVEQGREVERLQRELDEAQQKLSDREIRIQKAGTLAEAAFSLNGVYEAVEAAAKQYLDILESRSRSQQDEVEQILADARMEASSIRAEAQREANEIIDEAQTEQKRRMDEADAYAKNVVSRIRTVLENHPELREQLDRQ